MNGSFYGLSQRAAEKLCTRHAWATAEPLTRLEIVALDSEAVQLLLQQLHKGGWFNTSLKSPLRQYKTMADAVDAAFRFGASDAGWIALVSTRILDTQVVLHWLDDALFYYVNGEWLFRHETHAEWGDYVGYLQPVSERPIAWARA